MTDKDLEGWIMESPGLTKDPVEAGPGPGDGAMKKVEFITVAGTNYRTQVHGPWLRITRKNTVNPYERDPFFINHGLKRRRRKMKRGALGMNLKLSTILSSLDACAEAARWAKTQPDLQTAWANCKRSDWMLWLLDRTTLNQDDPRLRLMACDFAEAVLVYVPAGEDRPRLAIECARRFARGEATREEMAAARDAARAAAGAAAWSAARAAAGAAAWSAAWAAQSDIIRRYFPECPTIKTSLYARLSSDCPKGEPMDPVTLDLEGR